MALALSWLPRQAMHYDCSCSPCQGAGSGLLPSRARTKASGPWVCVVREERRMEEAGWTVAWIGEEDWVGWRMLQMAESSDKRPTEVMVPMAWLSSVAHSAVYSYSNADSWNLDWLESLSCHFLFYFTCLMIQTFYPFLSSWEVVFLMALQRVFMLSWRVRFEFGLGII